MAREMDLHALGQKTFAAALAPPGENRAPAFGLHARTETVLLFSGSLGSLQGALHREKARGRAQKERLL